MFGKILKSKKKPKNNLVVADLKIGSIVLPRSESPEAVSRLAEFEWFHKIDSEGDIVTPEIDDLLLRAQQTFQSIDDIVKKLGVPLTVGILEILFKGTTIKKKNYEIDEIKNMVMDLEKKSPAIIEKPAKLLEEQATTKRSLDEYIALRDTLQVAKKLKMNISGFGLLKYFYTNLFVINTTDYEEINRSLEDATVYKFDLGNKTNTALLVISDTLYSETVLKVMRSFNANLFVIPEGMPQMPSEAFALTESKIKELTGKQKKITKEIAVITKSIRRDILSIHETAMVAKDILETVRKPGGTKHFAVIQGFIPESMGTKFKKNYK